MSKSFLNHIQINIIQRQSITYCFFVFFCSFFCLFFIKTILYTYPATHVHRKCVHLMHVQILIRSSLKGCACVCFPAKYYSCTAWCYCQVMDYKVLYICISFFLPVPLFTPVCLWLINVVFRFLDHWQLGCVFVHSDWTFIIRIIIDIIKVKAKLSESFAYPWMQHFSEGC